MSTLVTQTKIIPPVRRADLLTRQRLLDLFTDLLDSKLIILAAPAGYGKTSLLVDYIYHTDIPVCWYSLDLLDKDPKRFLAHLFASIIRRFPEFGERTNTLVNSLSEGEFDLSRVVTALVNDLYENVREHFLIILDDYHLISGAEEVDTFINQFVQEVGENCHLVLSSRILLTLPDMPLMIARGLVSGLSYEELAFTSKEIQSLAFQNYRMSLPTEVAQELARETEGWVTGLLLSTHRNWKGDLAQLRAARISGVDLYDYLAQQVLDQQPPEVREFLLRTSLLEEFNEELCKKVIGEDGDIPTLMERLLTHNLFILPVGEDGRWIRYHHLFSDFLQERMLRERPTERDKILRRLAQVYLDQGEYEKSYETFRKLDDPDSTAKLISDTGSLLLKSGRLQTLATWFKELPEDIIISKPNLVSLRGAVRVMQGSVEEGVYWLRQAENAQKKTSDNKGLAITLIRLSSTLRFLGRYKDSFDKASESLALIDNAEEMEYPRAEALRSMGISLYHMGDVEEAADILTHAYRIYQSLDDRQNMALILMELGITSKIAGRYRKAQEYYEQALDIWRDTQNLVGQANLLNNLAVLHHIMGEHVTAGALYEEGLESAKLSGYERMQAYILSGIGDLYADIGAIESAKDAYQYAYELAIKSQERFLLLYIKLKEANLERRTGDADAARMLMDEVEITLQLGASKYEVGLWQLEAGHFSAAKDNYESTFDRYTRAYENFLNAGQKMDAARTCLYLAGIELKMNHAGEAEKHLREALRISSALDTQYFLVAPARDNRHLLVEFKFHEDIGSAVVQLFDQVTDFQENISTIRRQIRPHASAIQFVAPEFSIFALGVSQVKVNATAVTAPEWQNQRRVRELFFYLLEHPEGLTREEVGVVLWPESSTSQMKLQFKNALYRLRYALGQDVVLLEEDRYFFNKSLDYVYDVDEFTQAMNSAQVNDEPIQKIKALKRAISYYKGDFLADIDSSWLITERERLWQMYAEGILTLTQIYLEMGDYQQAIDYAQKLIDQDPCQEEAHRLAMRAFAARGDRASVIRQFELCRQYLSRGINAKPSQMTSNLYKSLIA